MHLDVVSNSLRIDYLIFNHKPVRYGLNQIIFRPFTKKEPGKI